MPARNSNDGLRKRCGCKRSAWTKGGACAPHPWHFSFYKKKCECAAGAKCAHTATNQVRVSLNKEFGKPPGYEMSKSEAMLLRDELRLQVQKGTFREIARPVPTITDTRLAFGDVADLYFDQHVRKPGRREGPIKAIENYLRIIRATEIPAGGGRRVRFDHKPMADITVADIEAVRHARRLHLVATVERRQGATVAGVKIGPIVLPGVRGGEVGIEHMMATLRHVFRWAVRKGHVASNPFKCATDQSETAIDVRLVAKSHRKRRLDREANEQERLLTAAVPPGPYGLGGRAPGMAMHLHDLIVAALESGCRKGELLSLQWWQVRKQGGVTRHIELPADKTKTSEPRKVPVTSRLRAILDFRRIGPDGQEQPTDAYVFGDEAGGRIKNVKTAWRAACRRAGIRGLNFHDLRHEFTSSMLDSGVPIHKVRDWVGHKNIATTSIYANTTLSHLDDAVRIFEARLIGTRLAQSADEANTAEQAGGASNVEKGMVI